MSFNEILVLRVLVLREGCKVRKQTLEKRFSPLKNSKYWTPTQENLPMLFEC